MKKGFWITVVLSGLVALFAFFLFVIWRPILISQEAEKGNNTVVKIDRKAVGKEEVKPSESRITVSDFIQDAEMSKEPGFKPFFDEEKDRFAETFLERFAELSKPLAPALPIPVFMTQKQKEQSSGVAATTIPEATSTEIILSLTDDEFHFLYPDDFLNSLMEAQNFIKEYIPDYQLISKIETDFQVRFIEEKMVAAFLLANMLTKEEAERAITSIRFTLPQLQLMELKNRKTTSLNESVSVSACFPYPFQKGVFFAGLLIERFYNVFIPRAQARVCGYCYSWSPCFQVGASNPAVGSNTFATFCYCTGCYWYAGCLSRCTGQSAIWDPMTSICGCG